MQRLKDNSSATPHDHIDRQVDDHKEYIKRLYNELALYQAGLQRTLTTEDSPEHKMIQGFSAEVATTIAREQDRIQAHIFFSSVKTILREGSYITDEPGSASLFYHSLRQKKLKCDTASIIYVSVGEALGYPVRLVLLPNHSFVRWDHDGQHDAWSRAAPENTGDMNWEARQGVSLDDDSYISRKWGRPVPLQLDRTNTGRTCYLGSLSMEEAISLGYKNAALAYFLRGTALDMKKGLDFSSRAIQANPEWDSPYWVKTWILEEMGDSKSASRMMAFANRLTPYRPSDAVTCE
jgi:hypothetical protein